MRTQKTKELVKKAMEKTIDLWISTNDNWVRDSIFSWFLTGLIFGNYKEVKLFNEFVKPKILSFKGKQEN